MIAGNFGQGLALPFGILPLLATMIGCGLWAGLVGRHQAVGVLLAYLAGMAVGVLVPTISSLLPVTGMALPLAIVAMGVLIGVTAPASLGIAVLVVFLVGVLVGLFFFGDGYRHPFTWDLLTWAGLACGALIATASGVGLSVMIRPRFAGVLVRLFGIAVAAFGLWLLVLGT